MDITLIYTDLPFWRAEIGRIALHVGGVAFADRRIDRDEFVRARTGGRLDDGTVVPFRQIPFLLVDGTSIAQTGGISRLCGKLSGLYPGDDLVQSALVDQVIDMATDLTVLLGPSNAETDPAKKKQMRLDLVAGALTKKIGYLEEQATRDGDGWLVGNRMTIADIAAWRLFGWLTSGIIDDIPADLIQPFPNLRGICTRVGQQPKVRDWVEKTYPEGLRAQALSAF